MTTVMVKDTVPGMAKGRPETAGPGPRERIVRSAAELIRAQGVSGTGMRAVVSHASAPRGSLQSYFPGGKDQLVTEALLWSGATAGRRVERVLDSLDPATPAGLFAGIVHRWREQFIAHGFEAGCPLVAAAADVAATSEQLRQVVGQAFDGWQVPLEAALTRTGVPKDRASHLAVLMISSLEGAIVLARIRREVTPLDIVVDELAPLLDAAVARKPPRRRP